MTHEVCTLGQIGRLCPIMIQEVAPGDTWSGKTGILVRLSPLKRALLSTMYVDQFTMYVPHRLNIPDWEDFIAAGPMDTPSVELPTINIGQTSDFNSIFLHRNSEAGSYEASAISTRAYNLIHNEYFRDEQSSIRTPDQAPGTFGAQVNFKKDYWTVIRENIGFEQTEHFADVTSGTPDQVSAIAILEAIARQKIATKRATYGTRYIDILRSYGINVNYQMLQRPEIVAMGRGSINVTDVVNTSVGNQAGEELGVLSGHGISGTRLALRRKTFPEHGTLMSFVLVRPVHMSSRFADWFDRKREYTSYYDPGLVPLPPVEVTASDVIPSEGTLPGIGFRAWGNWYRSSMSRAHEILDEWIGDGFPDETAATAVNLRSINSADYDNLFNDTAFGHFQVSAVHKMRALRALPRSNIAAGVNSIQR